ncbi:MAG: glutamate-1-semialdehyde 2,1-aminomutase [Gammaproteobacteria bacterium]
METRRQTTMDFAKSNKLRQKFHSLIPGGGHTYAKGDDQYPEHCAPYLVKGQGCRVWDADGNEFIEYGMGLRAVTLGHAQPEIVEAARQQMLLGANFTRPALLELECAEALLGLIEGAEMVKFAKNGSDATTAAVKLARAYTGRDMVAVCADHAFFSTDDWFIGSTPMAAGIPQAIRALTVKFQYNNVSSVNALFDAHPRRIAALILEPATHLEPKDRFLHELRRLCSENGAVLIFDETITGFRWHLNGAQKYYGVVPDLSTFGKALGNGFSISALLGRKEIMELGGLQHSKDRVFLLSTTHGAESHCLAAAIAVIKFYREQQVIERLYRQGERLAKGIQKAIDDNRLNEHFLVLGKPCNLIYATKDEKKQPSQPFRTLFLQETIKRGLLMPSLVVGFSHSDADVDYTTGAVAEALAVYRKAMDEGIDRYLASRPVKPVFRNLN